MLGTQPDVIETYVDTGQARIIFWPVLNYGEPSTSSTLAAECVAQQDIEAFWDLHRVLFENQGELWQAGRDYYADAAVAVGVQREPFEACYDEGTALEHVLALDQVRQERGIYSQPVFDINGELLYGSQSFDTFARVIEAALAP